ncbi:hypothetical protein VTL71DRAFT_12256 [Oculimacula yallundae]|uniref:Uncharacterized protein n=1 Tax=Oculimacula yallundae TaxID=86028 RepID=A0ABR4BPG7_9HELO
MTWRSKWD